MFINIKMFIIEKEPEKENTKGAGLDEDDVWGDVEDVGFYQFIFNIIFSSQNIFLLTKKLKFIKFIISFTYSNLNIFQPLAELDGMTDE